MKRLFIYYFVRSILFVTLILLFIASVIGGCSNSTEDNETLTNRYGNSLPLLDKQLKIYHLGHSLVGSIMPYMLAQLAGEGHEYSSQLGWGTRLKAHWDPNIKIEGFETASSHVQFENVFDAIDSKEFDAIVLTEGVEIKDAIKYSNSDEYLARFAKYISKKSPNTRIYFYETWHKLTLEEDWTNRLDTDYDKYWLKEILNKAIVKLDSEETIYVLPVGQVMSALFKKVKSIGGVKGLEGPQDILLPDLVHMNDLGAYLVALVHYAVLYQQNPEGLPYMLDKARGVPALAPSEEVARLMQAITWDVVSTNYRTGLAKFQPD